MNGKEITKLAIKNLAKQKLRSWLAMLGVVIGVSAVIVLVSLATGMNQSISSRLNSLGANILQISPGGSQASNIGAREISFGTMGGNGPGTAPRDFNPSLFGRESSTLTESDRRIISQIEGVKYASGVISGQASVTYKTKNASATINGVDSYYFDLISINLSAGRKFTSSDIYSAIIGEEIINRTFKEDLLNKYISINGVQFKVIGIMNSSSQAITSVSRSIIIPSSIAKSVLNKSTYSTIYVYANEDVDTESVQEDIKNALIDAHHVTETSQDFTITTQKTMQETVSNITGTLTLFLGGIGAISLLVGAIGVANTMFMSVLERTKEIGILKALGMTNGEITTLFLIESGFIGLIGGILGLLLSYIISFVISLYGLTSVITVELVFAAMLFSILIGIVAGIIPARNAAKLEPITALSYE